jgi:hypothetical protein
MQLPMILEGASRTRLLQGAAVGAAATVIIGFNWGGWVLGGTAAQMSQSSANAAVVRVLAPVCVEKFQRTAEAEANLTELKKVSSWQQGSFIEKGGWATIAGSASPDSAVARACAELLAAAKG